MRILLILRSILNWLIMPQVFISLILIIFIGAVAYHYTDVPAVALSVKGFFKKTLPKLLSKVSTKAGPLLARAFAKNSLKKYLLIFFGWMLTREAKEHLGKSLEVVGATLKYYLLHNPKEWWSRRSRPEKVFLVFALISFLGLTVSSFIFNAVFFIPLNYLRELVVGFFRFLWAVIKLFLPKGLATKMATWVEKKALPFILRFLLPSIILELPIVLAIRRWLRGVRWRQLKKLVPLRREVRERARRRKEKDPKLLRKRVKKWQVLRYAMFLIVFSAVAYSGPLA